MRGGRSELTDPANANNKTKGGFDKDYAFTWSYGIAETFTVMVPGIYGGGSSGKPAPVRQFQICRKVNRRWPVRRNRFKLCEQLKPTGGRNSRVLPAPYTWAQ